MLELVGMARKAGLSARYILFDRWFASPKTITAFKQEHGLDTIARVKKSKTRYTYGDDDEQLTIKQIYGRNKKSRGRSKYLLSVMVILNGPETILAKIVYVRNKSNRKDWLALITTDTELSKEEIICIYGKRWDIEVFFKSCKFYLRLVKGSRSTSYDALMEATMEYFHITELQFEEFTAVFINHLP